ncbi:MAG: pyridoxine 5'-phosphate synthase [Gammaproteobacteria bacterium]|nr:pyridoxine 5'-phosphate synthase [Gammaproteobacteria bacterium]
MSNNTLRLGVNIDHVATLREARKTDYPSPLEAALLAVDAGADGITIHLREDRRHIQDHDLEDLLDAVKVPINLELAVTDEMIGIAVDKRPAHVCLVPERREEITTEGGLDVAGNFTRVTEAVRELTAAGCRVSLFVDADPAQLDASARSGAAVVELHTGSYANAGADNKRELELIAEGARVAHQAGLEVHAGHGLTVQNVGPIAALPELRELNIGHAIIGRSVFVGLAEAIREMAAAMREARQ